jgi:hypothetical protein
MLATLIKNMCSFKTCTHQPFQYIPVFTFYVSSFKNVWHVYITVYYMIRCTLTSGNLFLDPSVRGKMRQGPLKILKSLI